MKTIADNIAGRNLPAIFGDVDYNFTKCFRDIPDILSSVEIIKSNGAIIISETELQIPTGETGQYSVFQMFPNWETDLYSEFNGKQIRLVASFNVTNWDESIPIRVRADNGGITQTDGSFEYNSETETIKAWVEIASNDEYVVDTAYFMFQLRSTVALSSTLNIKLENYAIEVIETNNNIALKGFENYLTEKQILYIAKRETYASLVSYTTITFDSDSNASADFTGATAIADALNSITDNSETKRYRLVGRGQFVATDASGFTMPSSIPDNFAIIEGKDYVDIEGASIDSLVIAGILPDDLGTDFDYDLYQPVVWNAIDAKLSNCTIIAKNCRYAIHLEGQELTINSELYFDNCYIWHQGNYNDAEAVWGSDNAFGTGIRQGQTFDIRKCIMRGERGNPFACHSPFASVDRGSFINLIDCTFIRPNGTPIQFTSEGVSHNTVINLQNPKFESLPQLSLNSIYAVEPTTADYQQIDVYSDSYPICIYNPSLGGQGVRITSKSVGVGSIVSFDETSVAFDLLIGNSADIVERVTRWGTPFQYGYEWRNGGVGLSGVAIGHTDVDESSSYTSMGIKLGDCSTVNKALVINVDSTPYTVTFNQDYTALSNTTIIAEIVAVIGTVADVDTYAIGTEYYPSFKGNESCINADVTAILKGMGIIKLGGSTMRMALNSDDRIDGICLDNIAVGQTGRIIEKGILHSMKSTYRFSTLEVDNVTRNVGDELGISTTQAGYFDLAATPKLAKCIYSNMLEIL